MRRIFISAGDPSGDIHAARLMKAMTEAGPDIEFIGIGGEKMTEAGLKSLVHISEISVVGFYEVAKKYTFFKKLLKKCENQLLEGEIDAFIPVDYPGFNIRLATFAKKNNIPVLYYIAPQLWAWGKNRANKLAGAVDKLLVVFPFEVEFFERYGIETFFMGHPLLDNPIFSDKAYNYNDREKKIAFLPGSRRQEVLKHISLMTRTAYILKNRLPDYKIAIAKSSSVDSDIYDKIARENPGWIFENDSRKLMLSAAAGLVKTGTSTLEASLCGMPFAMFYRTSNLSYQLSRRLINLPYISLTNILAEKFVNKEFIQKEAGPILIAGEIEKIIKDKSYRTAMIEDFRNIKEILGANGASKRAAEYILRNI